MNWRDHTSNMDLSTAAFPAEPSGSGDAGWLQKRSEDNLKKIFIWMGQNLQMYPNNDELMMALAVFTDTSVLNMYTIYVVKWGG